MTRFLIPFSFHFNPSSPPPLTVPLLFARLTPKKMKRKTMRRLIPYVTRLIRAKSCPAKMECVLRREILCLQSQGISICEVLLLSLVDSQTSSTSDVNARIRARFDCFVLWSPGRIHLHGEVKCQNAKKEDHFFGRFHNYCRFYDCGHMLLGSV